MGPQSCSVFIQNGGFKSFENYVITVLAKETN